MALAKTVLADMAQDILAYVESRFTAHAVEAFERVYLSHGEPANDCCNQLTIHISRVFRGQPGNPDNSSLLTQPCVLIRSAEMVLTLFRCVPVSGDDGSPPPVADLAASAEDLAIDGWLLNEAIREGWGSDQFSCGCLDLSLGELRAIQPSGGCAGWTQTFEVAVGACPGMGS